MGFDITDVEEAEFDTLVTVSKRLITFEDESGGEADDDKKTKKKAAKVDKDGDGDNIDFEDLDLTGLKRYGVPNAGKSMLSPDEVAKIVSDGYELFTGKI